MRTVFVLVVFTCSIVGQLHGHPTRDELLNKMDDLSRQMDSMDGKLDELTEDMAVLLQTSGRRISNNTDLTMQPGERPNEDGPHSRNPFDILSVERSPGLGGSTSFNVRVRKNSDHAKIIFQVYDFEGPGKHSDSVNEGSDGITTFTFVFENITAMKVTPWFVVGDNTTKLGIGMSLNMETSAAEQVFDREFPYIYLIDDPSDIVYQPGRDRNVTVAATLGGFERDDIRLGAYAHWVDLETRKFHLAMNQEEVLQDYPTEQRTTDSGELLMRNLTLLVSSKQISGSLNLAVDVNSEGSVVEQAQVSKEITIRPDGQAGRYPPGYLTIIEMPGLIKSDDGNELQVCEKDEDCSLSCWVVGERITDAGVSRLLNDGDIEPVEFDALTPDLTDTYRHIYWTLTPEDLAQEVKGYKCWATDSTSGSFTSKIIEIANPSMYYDDSMFIFNASVDPARSNISVTDDPNNPGGKIVRLNCAIEVDSVLAGLTTETFSWPYYPTNQASSSFLPLLLDAPPDEVLHTSGGTPAVAVKTVTLEPAAARELADDVNARTAEPPSCSVSVWGSGETNSFVFELSPNLFTSV